MEKTNKWWCCPASRWHITHRTDHQEPQQDNNPAVQREAAAAASGVLLFSIRAGKIEEKKRSVFLTTTTTTIDDVKRCCWVSGGRIFRVVMRHRFAGIQKALLGGDILCSSYGVLIYLLYVQC